MTTWWKTASQKDRLAQIDGGIELNMTSRQIAMNCGAPIYSPKGDAVGSYGREHGRSFPNGRKGFPQGAANVAYIVRNRNAGRPEARKSEVRKIGAFDIFPPASRPKHLFDPSEVD